MEDEEKELGRGNSESLWNTERGAVLLGVKVGSSHGKKVIPIIPDYSRHNKKKNMEF